LLEFGRHLTKRLGPVRVGAVIQVVAAFLEPWFAAEIDAADVLGVGRSTFVAHQILYDLLRVAVHQHDATAGSAVASQDMPRHRGLDNAASAGEDRPVFPRSRHLGEQLKLGFPEALPASGSPNHVWDGHAAATLKLHV